MHGFQVENNLQELIDSYSKETFIYKLLLAYGLPKASITRLQKGNLNLSRNDDEIIWKKKVFFKEVFDQDLHVTISELHKKIKNNERFVIVTDYKTFLAIDTKTQDKLDIELKDLPKYYDFFLPWAGREKAQYQNENPADVKAAEKMAKLFDEIKKDNPDDSPEFIHGLNVFLCRLLFCFFAEDTNIFKKGQFTNATSSHTHNDGSDLSIYLARLFEVLNTPEEDRQILPEHFKAFPYVNGGLFRQKLQIPTFTRRSRQAIIDSGGLDWSIINPDIFGSMMQAVKAPELRGDSGIHYTSVPNIMKVIEPLFLNNLKEAFEKSKGNQKKRNELLKRLRSIKIFDPACGSGNFLIITYKELRRLEMKIFKESDSNLFVSSISLRQFYGIELDDFAHEIAQLSLWLAEHQMNVEFLKMFGCTNPTLPLNETGNIVQGNACRIDWETVCPKKENDEIYILGNPPYLGARLQSEDQKTDIETVFKGIKDSNNLDYIACWFKKGADFISNSESKFAFVSTNSICQGSQVPLLWKLIFQKNLEIDFAYKAFKWSNNARDRAGVVVIILGLRNTSKLDKILFKEEFAQKVENISPYLVPGNNTIVESRTVPISQIPQMVFGSMPNDGGFLIFDENEREELLNNYPGSLEYFKRFIGSSEFIRGNNRWCLWLNEKNYKEASLIPAIEKRISKVKEVRITSKRPATKKLSSVPFRFAEIRHKESHSIIIPSVSSERREYIPIGFLDSDTVISNLALAIYDVNPWLFALLNSKIHMIWVHSIGGYLGTSIRYSISVCYSTFPFPTISDTQKQELEKHVFSILKEREKHSEKTLAQLYDPVKMPEGLLEAHRLNDLAVDRCYRSKPFESDEERLEHLFNLYEKMAAEEIEREDLA